MPAAPAAAPAAGDSVDLNDGTHLAGQIVSQEPGKYVVIRLGNGSQQTIMWGDVRRVTMGPPQPAAAPAPAPAPTPSAAPATATATAAPVAPATATGGPGVPSVRTSTGEAVQFTLAPPPKYIINFAIGGNAEYSSYASATFVGGGMEIGAHSIIGIKPFPDTHGGDWQGIMLQGFLQPHGGGIINGDASGGYFQLFGGIGAGYTYMRIRDLDLDYSQRGWGIAVTYRLGADNTWVWASGCGSSSCGNGGGFAHGPAFQFLLPSYAAHRGVLSYGWINANVVFESFTYDTLVLFQVGGGSAF
jgi:hypothetical protein